MCVFSRDFQKTLLNRKHFCARKKIKMRDARVFFFCSGKTEAFGSPLFTRADLLRSKGGPFWRGGRCQELCVIPADMSHRAGEKSLGCGACSFLGPIPVYCLRRTSRSRPRSQNTRCLTTRAPSSSSVPVSHDWSPCSRLSREEKSSEQRNQSHLVELR